MTIIVLRLPVYAVILFFLFISHCKSVQRIQRRFMWKQMDDTVDGLLDTMASNARAMFGDLIPGMTTSPTPFALHGSKLLDYLPSETTKVKYIIRGTSAKPMKYLKMNAPKKVVKVMTIPKPIVEDKFNKPKSRFPSAETMRQLEKEQEMIAEGRLPHFDADALRQSNDITTGQIHEFADGNWKPISTAKPHAMSNLHTSVVGEQLPEPEKIVYQPHVNEANEIDGGNVYDYTKHKNSYEVTEHSPEESIAIPFRQAHYLNSRGFIPIRNSNSNHHQSNARVGLIPKKTTTTTTSTTSTTTEAPNYPLSFLKKQRERPSNFIQPLFRSLHDKNGTKTNETALSVKLKILQSTLPRVKTENWSYAGPTILPSVPELLPTPKLSKPEPLTKSSKEERLRPKSTKIPVTKTTSQPHDIRQRGSIKFGDKLTELYK